VPQPRELVTAHPCESVLAPLLEHVRIGGRITKPALVTPSLISTHALESLLNPSRLLVDPASLASYAIDNLIPSAAARPASAEEAAEIVRFAAKEKLAVIPSGARTKLSLGATPIKYDIALDISGVNQIAHYDPADLTVSVDAGMPVAALNAALVEQHQFLPLLVPYYSQSTIGGAIASGMDSPLRNAYGSARDFLLGAEFIDGTGARVKSGGRVVKNVAGYDLHKLLVGSLGTLAVITRLNFRTFPAPLQPSGFLASFSTCEAAIQARRQVVQSALIPLTLDVINPGVARIFAERTPTTPEPAVFASENHQAAETSLPLPGQWFRSNDWQLCAGFAGVPEVLDRYARDLTRIAEDCNATSVSILDATTRPTIWGRLREALPLFRQSSSTATVLKLNVLPARHAQAITILESVANAASLPLAIVARASGTLYIALMPESASESSSETLILMTQEVFALSRSLYGDASLLFAPATIKLHLHSILDSRPTSDLSVMRNVKSAFDPQHIFATLYPNPL
jgi:glycolate oxidase FAD binding subunit